MKKVIKNTISYQLLIGLILLVAVAGCDDIVEDDITNENVTVISPTEGQLIRSNLVSFQWNELDGVDHYRVQISNETNAVIADSLVINSYLDFPLSAGDYSWRVRGENFAYETAYTFPGSFQVEETNDLTNQTLVLNSPSNNLYIDGSSAITTTWTSIANADSYVFELVKNPGSLVVFNQPGITNTLYTIEPSNLTEDAAYVWKVKGKNDSTSTETAYASRTFFVDSQAPNTPLLGNPPDESFANIDEDVTFVWENGTDTGEIQSAIASILEIATDIGFTNVLNEYTLSTNSQVLVFSEIGDYYWRVRNEDLAGNESDLSDTRKITLE